MSSDLAQVARRAGVSSSTASRALRDLPSISAATKARVRAAAVELDYAVSPTAARLATGRTGSIGVVTTYIGRWYFSQVLAGVEAVLHASDYDVLLYALSTEESRTKFFTDMPLRRRVDGVLMITLPATDLQLRRIRALGVPVSAVGMAADGITSVLVDDVAGARAATNHLINLGHRRIAMIGGGESEPNPFTTPRDRQAGYRGAMADAGLAVPAGYECDGQYTIHGGELAMVQLLGAEPMPTAVFCQSDRMAMGAMRAIRRSGLRCPGDVSIVGMGDDEIAEPLDLTTVAQSGREQGALAAGLLLDGLAGGPGMATSAHVLPMSLVVRASAAPPGSLAGDIMFGAG